MAHPYNSLRQHHVERNRVSDIVGKAEGGKVDKSPPAPLKIQNLPPAPEYSSFGRGENFVKGLLGAMDKEKAGRSRGGRLDKYARGGKVKKGTTVNVVIAGQGGDKQPMPVPVPAPALAGGSAPMPPPRPPMIPPGGPGAAPPPGMPPGIRRSGGRAYASGGGVKSGRTWEEGKSNGTQMSHAPGKGDTDKINKSPPLLTRKRGGRAYPLSAGADSGEGRLQRTKSQRSFKTA